MSFDFFQKWGSCMSCTRWVEWMNVMYKMWLCDGRAVKWCVDRPDWLRIEEVFAVWNFWSVSPLFPAGFAETLTLTAQTAVENFTLSIFQLKVVSSIVDTCSQINSGFRTINPRWFWISNLFSVISSFSYFYCPIYFSFTVVANSAVFDYHRETEVNH